MELHLNSVSRKFNKEWIFRDITRSFLQKDIVAITGPNGSGKTTLLQIIAGSLIPTSGQVIHRYHQKEITADLVYMHLSMVTPALELPEDFTLMEFLNFHFTLKGIKLGYAINDLPEVFQLGKARDKYIRNFSTGMKQRLKLGVALYSDTPLLLLDEPATNLDRSGFEWYLKEIDKVLHEKMIFVCSNRTDEYPFCTSFLDIMEFKR